MTESSEALSALIAKIYDAALDRSLWPGTLKLICEFAGGHGSTLFAHDAMRPHATLFFNYNNDPEYLRLYTEKYIHMNPLMPAVTYQEVGRVFTLGQLVVASDYHETAFYKEFQKPQGIIDSMFVNLEKSGTSHMTISLIATEKTGAFDAGRQRRLALLAPHIRRSAVIGHLMSSYEAEKQALTAALSQAAVAVFLVDVKGRIEFSNDAGTAMLQEGKVLRSEQGSLAVNAAGTSQTLRDTFAAASGGDAVIGEGGVSVVLTSLTGERWLAHVLPLTSGARKQMVATYTAVAAVFVRKPGLESRSALEVLSRLYRLTATETRVLQAVVETGGVPQIAELLGVGEATIRSHLRSLFSKTGLNRQSDLVKLVAEHASPFVRQE